MIDIYAIIPARKGSKRLPHKNITKVGDKLLIEHAIVEAKKSQYITDIIVTTDDPVVLRIAKKYGLKYRQRPSELCTDTATTQEVVDDIRWWVPWDHQPDGWVLLQPTSPLRTVKHIDKCIKSYMSSELESVITVSEVAPYVYYPNGAVYVFKRNLYPENMGMVLMKPEESIDIDTKWDLEYAKSICRKLS